MRLMLLGVYAGSVLGDVFVGYGWKKSGRVHCLIRTRRLWLCTSCCSLEIKKRANDDVYCLVKYILVVKYIV